MGANVGSMGAIMGLMCAIVGSMGADVGLMGGVAGSIGAIMVGGPAGEFPTNISESAKI